jgi:arylsulfatase A-like enzyme
MPVLRAKSLPLPVAAVTCALAVGGCGHEPADAARPDVVLIVIDTLRADRLGSYGYPRATSPRMDRLAAEGARFADVTAQSSWTLPSMVSLFTGRYLTDYRDFPAEDAPVLAEAFHAAGYATVGVVGNVLLQPEQGYDRGFDHYDARPGEQPPGVDAVRARSIEELEEALWGPVDAALAGPDKKPLFLYLHPFDPHAPYAGSTALDAELPPSQAPPVEPAGWPAAALAERGPAPPAGRADWAPELAGIRRGRGLYDQDVRLTDEGVARVLAGLEQRGVLERAVVAILSDHGECLWERVAPKKPDELRALPPPDFFYQEHGAYLYEEGVRTPFLLWGAGVPAGVVVDAPVENVDLFPTLLELCDVPARGSLHGRSLVPLLDGTPPAAWRENVYAQLLHSRSIRELATGKKLIVPTEHGEKVGVPIDAFDLAADPHERAPIEDAGVRERLRGKIEAWRERYPTESTLGRKRDAASRKMLGDLGYTDAHTGG